MSSHLSSIRYLLVLVILLALTIDSRAGLFDFVDSEKAKVEVGSPAPDFKGTDFLNRKEFNGEFSFSKDLKGKVIMLDFWSVYCVSCLKEIPKLVEIYNKYKDKDIFFIGVDLDTNKRRLKMFLKDPKKVTPYAIVMDKTRVIANAYNVNILPTTIIIGKSGNIEFYHEGYKPGDEHEIEEMIQNLINE